jgi:hypothetical protein
MAPHEADAVFRSVLIPNELLEAGRETSVVELDHLEARQELSGSLVESTSSRCVFEILAPDGRSLISLERGA